MDEVYTISIKHAQVSDAETVARIHVESWLVAYKDTLPKAILESLSLSKRTKNWQETIAKNVGSCLLAKANQNAMGFVYTCPCRDKDKNSETVGEISALYLLPHYWRQGLGSSLLYSTVSHLRQQGFNEATLWVLENNLRARNFYQKHRFKQDGASKIHPSSGLLEVRYTRTLV